MDNEQVDIDIDDFDEKLELADAKCLQDLFVPIMVVADTDKQSKSLHQKTYFLLEKLKLKNPSTSKAEDFVALFDSGSGKSVANGVEKFDTFSEEKSSNIVLTSLNGIYEINTIRD